MTTKKLSMRKLIRIIITVTKTNCDNENNIIRRPAWVRVKCRDDNYSNIKIM